MTELWRDLCYTVRILRKTPVVTAAAILSLALGIGANTAVFTLLNGVMLRPLPVPEPGKLWALSTTFRDGAKSLDSFSLAMLEELEKRQTVFSGLLALSGGGLSNFEMNGESYAAALDTVGGDYFATLGVRPFLGRFITAADVATRSGRSSQVAVLSYQCWQQRFHADAGVTGKTIRVDGVPLIIIGVAPQGFDGFQIDAGPDATVPIGYKGRPSYRELKNTSFELAGRLRRDVTPEQAKAQLTSLWREVLTATLPENMKGNERADFLARRVDLQSASTGNSYLRARLQKPLVVMMALVNLVLLIACVNLANLMLARAAARDRELRLRLALGARPWRLTRNLLL